MDTFLKYATGAGISTVSYIFGGVDGLFASLLLFMVLDTVTGIMASGYEGETNSVKGYKGIIRKLGILAVVVIAHQLDGLGLANLTTGFLPFESPARDLAILFYIGNEGISNLENLGRMGVPLPKFLKKGLEVLKTKGEDEKDGEKLSKSN